MFRFGRGVAIAVHDGRKAVDSRPRSETRPALEKTHGGNVPLGPVDVYVIAFPGNQFRGEIVPEILTQVSNGTIRVLDVLFVMKDSDGTIAVLDIENLGPEGASYVELDLISPGALNEEDADEVAESIPEDTSALLIAFENTWMQGLVGAFARAGALPIDHIRIPATVVNAVVAD
jgi:hypothetical protein